jgi:tripartite-type tricarboxylate transporter receptor subunit TctC
MNQCRGLVVLFLLLFGAVAGAQDYPLRTVRIVTAEAGGSNDIATRIIAQPLGTALGQQFIVENMGQASGVIAAQTVAKASPDGYTLILYGASLWLLPFFRDNPPFDLARDFAPVIWTNRGPNLMVVHPSLPVKTVRELIVLARARPGALNYGSSSLGAANHLAAELFKTMARVDIVHIPYKGTSPALNDVIGGQLQVMFPNAPSAGPHVRSGKLRGLAITSAQPSPLFPELPTVAATGLPGYEAVSIYGVFAPAKTPPAIVAKLNAEIGRILSRAEVKERFAGIGVETVGGTPGEFSAVVQSETMKWGKVIRDAGIRAE